MASLNVFTGVLGTRRAAHLLRRVTFGPTRKQIDDYALMTPAGAVAKLLDTSPITNKPIDYATGETWVDNFRTSGNTEEGLLKQYVVGWWINNARKDDTIQHKMVLFLHQNWITNYENRDSEMHYDYLKLLEFFSVGNYKTLAYKMCFNNSMLLYLDGAQNSASSPNENYAREFLELFTIGKYAVTGDENYTENDIKQAAKVFTGYRFVKDNNYIDPDTGIRVCTESLSRHSTDDKYFSDALNNTVIAGRDTVEGMYQEVAEFIDTVFDKIETAQNICRKLYRFFVYPHISTEVEADIITPLALKLKNDNYEMKGVLETLFKSKHFYDEDDADNSNEFVGGILKSPLELLLGIMRFFNVQPPDEITATYRHYHNFYHESVQGFFLDNAGMKLFRPDNVIGYPPYYQNPDYNRLWLNPSTIVSRYTLPRMLLENKRILISGYFHAYLNILEWVDDTANISDPGDGRKLVDEITRYLFPENPYGTERFDFFLNEYLLGSLSLTNWRMEWNNYKSTGNSESVVLGLQSLLKGILFSQEHQLQ